MAETQTITDHQTIRDWAAARTARPAITEVPTGTGDSTRALSFVFGQEGIHDHGANNTEATDRRTMVEWDEWFEVFDSNKLALLVPDMEKLEDSYQLLAR